MERYFNIAGPCKPWEEKLYRRDVPFAEKTIHVVGL